LASVALATKGKAGSMVIICTDGLANRGLGGLDVESDETKKFYEKISSVCKENGIVVSVVTIKGDGCKIDVLGKISEET